MSKDVQTAPLLTALAAAMCGRGADPDLAEASIGTLRAAIAPGGSALLATFDTRIWTAAQEVSRLHGTLVRHASLDAIVHRLAGGAEPP